MPERKTLSDFNFKQADPEDMLKLLEGHEDVLGPAAQRQQDKLQGHTCHKCGQLLTVRPAPHPFSGGRVLPRYIGSCPNCKIEGILIDA